MLMEGLPFLTFFYSFISFSIFFELSIAADTITPTQSISDSKTLVSSGQSFELGFFSPGNSKNRYLGIWYKNTPSEVVWVANRNNPITDPYGVLTISSSGNLVLLNRTKSIIWSSNVSGVAQSPIAQLLESGNLVLSENTRVNSENYLWQSFDNPSDTLLPDMKMGWNLNTGLEKYLRSWRSTDDPSPGDFTYRVEIHGLSQLVVGMGSTKKFRTGAWNGVRFSGLSLLPNSVFNPIVEFNKDEVYYMYKPNKNALITRLTINQSGLVQRLVLNERSTEWAIMYSVPNDPCDIYRHCGANGICRINKNPICECLEGFTPKSHEEWQVLNWSSGCVRRMPLACHSGDGFVQLLRVKLPDLLQFSLNKSMSLKVCGAKCLKNCSCTAYASSDIRGGGSGCLMWFGDLIDIREFTEEDSEQDMYLRLPASELESIRDSNKKRKLVIILVVLIISGMLILGLVVWCIIWKRRTERTERRGLENEKKDIELPFFDFPTIATATNNFSQANRIGAGGFGPVYKGDLPTGQEIAVKRLSKDSEQGLKEFKNEIVLIAKLQHRNLVGLLGCCIQGEERMLIYEYMPNKSLDQLIFDHRRSMLLTWQQRFDIVMGIARGLLYLHQDSKLQIIHRDLKTSNILLDNNLNPKISDFGLARTFGGDEKEAKTKRIIGTYGYMSPEYAIDGKFSVKSDVFSFGVLLLEIVTGKKNRRFCHLDHHHNLLGHAWLLWNEDRALELMDTCLEDSCVRSQVLSCIQVGLLCVQKFPEDRPTMSSVVFMLANEGATLPQPKQPGFFIERSSNSADSTSREEELHTENALTITMPEGR